MLCIFVTKRHCEYCYNLLSKFILEGKGKLQLEVNENVDEFSQTKLSSQRV